MATRRSSASVLACATSAIASSERKDAPLSWSSVSAMACALMRKKSAAVLASSATCMSPLVARAACRHCRHRRRGDRFAALLLSAGTPSAARRSCSSVLRSQANTNDSDRASSLPPPASSSSSPVSCTQPPLGCSASGVASSNKTKRSAAVVVSCFASTLSTATLSASRRCTAMPAQVRQTPTCRGTGCSPERSMSRMARIASIALR